MARLLSLLLLLALCALADPLLTPPPVEPLPVGPGQLWSSPNPPLPGGPGLYAPEEWAQILALMALPPTDYFNLQMPPPPAEPFLLPPALSFPLALSASPPTSVPEPSSLALAAAGLLAAAVLHRSRATLKSWGTRGSDSMES